MDSPAWTLFFTIMIGAYSINDAKNVCGRIKGTSHLDTPQTMTNKQSQCGKIYGNNSCCSDETARLIEDEKNALNEFLPRVVNLKDLVSAECDDVFENIACLSECSPSLNEYSSIKDVPLCSSTCHYVYKACKEEVTCTADWNNAWDNKSFDCHHHLEDNKRYPQDKLRVKVTSVDQFCTQMRTRYNVKDSDSDCFNVTTGKWMVLESQQYTSYHVFVYIGVAVIAIAIALSILVVAQFVMKRNRLMRGI